MSKFICKNCGNIFTKDIKTAKISSVQCPKCKSMLTEYFCSDAVDIKINQKIQTNGIVPPQVNFNKLFSEFMNGICYPQNDFPGRRNYIQ